MAKLNKETQKQVDEADGGSYEPIPPGAYHVKLVDVDSTREGPKGPYWSWEFDVAEGDHKGRKLWNNTSLSAAAAFSLKGTFEAFGVGSDTDTDDLIGQHCKAIVSTRTIQAGDRKGELTNQIDRLAPADDGFAAEGSESDDDIFA